MTYTLYILRCADDSFYTGIARDLAARLAAHRTGKGSKYVRTRLPVEVVYQEEFPDRSSASRREWEIKQLTRKQKEALINAN